MVMNWIRSMRFVENWIYERAFRKSKKQTETLAQGLQQLYHVAMTCHGRYQLRKIVASYKAGQLDVDPLVIDMYLFVLESVPYRQLSYLN